jgi:hypothetical protein
MKTLFTLLLVFSLGNVFAEDQVSTDGTICADRASGKMATSTDGAEESIEEAGTVSN